MESYIVRIYRQDTSNPQQMTGTVVRAGDDIETSFSSSIELINLLSRLETEPLRMWAHHCTAAVN